VNIKSPTFQDVDMALILFSLRFMKSFFNDKLEDLSEMSLPLLEEAGVPEEQQRSFIKDLTVHTAQILEKLELVTEDIDWDRVPERETR